MTEDAVIEEDDVKYVCYPASKVPFPIVTDFMIAWTAAHGSMSERWNLLRAIEKRRGKTIRLFYERRMLHWYYCDEK